MPSNNDARRIADLARKWMDGSISEEELASFEEWYNSFDDGQPAISPDETPEALRERLYDSILRREFPEKKVRTVRRYAYPLVACLVILAFMSFWWVQNGFDAAPFVRLVEIRAGVQINRSILPDGTIIWLKPGTRIKYRPEFGDRRHVSMSGEALFEVAKDPLRPFTVSVGDYHATALGTSFYIKQAVNRRDMVLAVFTGKVKVGRKGTASPAGIRLVRPEEKLRTGRQLVMGRMSKKESKLYTAGTAYDMDFQNTPFATVVERIEQKFDVDIEGKMERYTSCRFTADLTDQDLEYTLKLLTRSVGIDYQLKDKIVLFEGGGCE